MFIVMIDPANMFLCHKSENFWKLWRSLAFLKIGCRALAFHIFKNLRLFDKKLWQACVKVIVKITEVGLTMSSHVYNTFLSLETI